MAATKKQTTTATTTKTKEAPRSPEFEAFMKKSVKFTPLAEQREIEITVEQVINLLAVKSKSGKSPDAAAIRKFMKLCEARCLNPFVSDAFLIGYDTQKDGTKWNLVTAIQALRKRAEANPDYDGCRKGVILLIDGVVCEREGALLLAGEKDKALIGGWATVHRRDRSMPATARISFEVYNTGLSRWAKDPGGMISKCAEAAALREAFPSDLAGLYIREEFDRASESPAAADTKTAPPKDLNDVAKRIANERVTGADDPTISQVVDDRTEGIDELHDDADAIQDAGPAFPDGSAADMTAEELADLEREEILNQDVRQLGPKGDKALFSKNQQMD